ncbi:hypothetical protein L228DRAFT_280214 [Xylona heveae TC161]|uniref:Uncharacterized protein n=1 Tax=Xylona heveae (strain CBS 132557 / TC161) TaxID=1328760 RepID=A0A165IHX6_XYLHT|nr:hypothetical protein L228DRAFT_280214 [Xylona heveae TC161]KZF24923.1 hypothetical protein L228DRAFT_280214 [Xylona heveae TC161]
MSSETDKRLQVNLKGFSEAVAVSQRAINNNLEALLKIYPEFGEINIRAHDGNMNAQLNSGQVALHITDGNRGMVDYYCRFKSGTVSVWDDDLDDFTDDIDMTGWVFAFGVSMGAINVDEGTEEHKEIRSVINQPGDYSILRLYLDFNTHTISSFNQAASDFCGYEFSESGMISFLAIMLKWGKDITDAVNEEPRKTTIGYSAKVNDPNSVNEEAPTFPPTSVKFQNYEYLAQGQTTPTDGVGAKGDNNVLLYLEMTQHQSFPPEQQLTYSGNFVTPDMDGTICISREVFFDSYLLRTAPSFLLNSLNSSIYAWIAGDRNVHADTEYPSPEKNLKLGPGSDKDGNSDFFTFNPVVDNRTKWEWKQHDYTLDDPREVKLQYWVENNHALELKPGTNQMVLSGEAKIHFKNQYYPIYLFGGNQGCEASATATWAINITLNSVKEGGLEISLNLPDDPNDLFEISPYFDDWPFSNIYPPYGEHLKERMQSAITVAPLWEAARELQTALSSTARFVVPGGGTFFYKNPIFNNNGDVMIEAQYNGVDA